MRGRETSNNLPKLKVTKDLKCTCVTGETAYFDIRAQRTVQRDEEKEGNAAKNWEVAPTDWRGLLSMAFGLKNLVVQFISGWTMLCCKHSLNQSLIYLCLQGRSKAENLKQHLRHQMVNYGVPDVSQYCEARIKCKKVQQGIHTWERKVRIAQVYFTSPVPIGEPRPHFFFLSHFSWKCCAQTLNSSRLFGSDDQTGKR